jgi:hypothetical protein
MSLTVTEVRRVSAVGPGLLRAVYNIAWDSSYPTGGEAIGTQITTDFDYVFGASVISNDTLADNGYHIGCLVPAPTTAASSSNVLLTVHWEKNPADAGGADIPFPEFTNTGSLSAIGQTTIVVWGA